MEMRDTQTTTPRVPRPVRIGRTFRLAAFGLASIGATFLSVATNGSGPASAQVSQAACGDRGKILENLDKLYSEKPHAIAVSEDGKLLEVVVSSSGSWSILLTRPDKRTCVVATGDSWESLPAVAKDPSA